MNAPSIRSLVVATLLLIPDYCAAQSFHRTGDLKGGGFETLLFGVSGDGRVAVGSARGEHGMEAASWRHEGLAPLGDLDGDPFASFARAASADGSVIVGAGNWSPVAEATRLADGVLTGLGHLGEGTISEATDVSADGSIVVGRSTWDSDNLYQVAFRWDDGAMASLGLLPGANLSMALGVSDDGEVIVGESASTDGNGISEGFRWENGVMISVGSLTPGGSSRATAVSGDGNVIIGVSSGEVNGFNPFHGFRWENGEMTDLGMSPNGRVFDYPEAVSADGSVIVGRGESSSACCAEAFIWDAIHGARQLDDAIREDYGITPSVSLIEATGISADGKTIVGYGHNSAGHVEGWIISLPEPSALAIMLVGIAAGALLRRCAVVNSSKIRTENL